MRILDLSYLEGVSEGNSVSGGALAVVVANASGTSTFTSTSTTAKELGNGGSMAKGKGIAIGAGGNPTALVDLYGEGDKVLEKIKTKYFHNKDMVVTKGFIKVFDRS